MGLRARDSGVQASIQKGKEEKEKENMLTEEEQRIRHFSRHSWWSRILFFCPSS